VTARREAFAASIARLREVLKQPENDVSRDAAIQRFEFCFELAWNSIQERARERFPDLQESVVPECLYPSISLGTVRFSNRRESRRTSDGPPTKTIGGDNFGRQLAAGRFI
jgi:hypothetical protein